MAKKSFKNSAKQSVATAFLSDTQEPQKNDKDIVSETSIKSTPSIYRLNLKLKGEYKEYLDQVSWENRTSITQYLNNLIEKDREEYFKKQK